jgi:ATP-binding protein involved in chromosome partitioning
MSKLDSKNAKQVLAAVSDPAMDKDIVKFRLVRNVEVNDKGEVLVDLDIPSHAYPQAQRDELESRVKEALSAAGAASVTVSSRVETAWTPPPSNKAILPGVRNIIAVAAGKGGVGKSTVAVNLALALRAHGAKVGLLDADVFGPSMPTMLGPATIPASTTEDEKIVPAVHHELKVISVGFFVDPGEAVVWRGPMVHRLLQQFLVDVEWGDLDYLVCDLPPGTGDVQLSLSQLIPITGAVLVTTPQEMSLVDVVKGAAMFNKVEIPLLGVVENMSYYQCPSCGHQDDIFSHGGGRRLAGELGVDLLAELPLDTRIRFAGDSGVPLMVASPDSKNAERFLELGSRTALKIAERVLAKPKRSPRLAVIS